MSEENNDPGAVALDRTWYVYVDYTTESEPRAYYVGKGLIGRLRNQRRNKHHRFVSKSLGLSRVIVFMTSSESEAFDHEISLIKELNTYNSSFKMTLDDIRCNKTLGGEGKYGAKHTDTYKEMMRQRMTGKNHPGFGKPGNRTGMNNSSEMRRKQSIAITEWHKRRKALKNG